MSIKLCRRCEEPLRETKSGYACRNGCDQVTARPSGAGYLVQQTDVPADAGSSRLTEGGLRKMPTCQED